MSLLETASSSKQLFCSKMQRFFSEPQAGLSEIASDFQLATLKHLYERPFSMLLECEDQAADEKEEKERVSLTCRGTRTTQDTCRRSCRC